MCHGHDRGEFSCCEAIIVTTEIGVLVTKIRFTSRWQRGGERYATCLPPMRKIGCKIKL